MKQKKDTRSKKQQSNGEKFVWLLKELGVYSDDPIIDKKINNELKRFLYQQGVSLAKIKFKKD